MIYFYYFPIASTFIIEKLINWICKKIKLRNNYVLYLILFLHLCNRNSLSGLVHFFQNYIFFQFFSNVSIVSTVYRWKSLAGLVINFKLEKNNSTLCIFLLFLHFCKGKYTVTLIVWAYRISGSWTLFHFQYLNKLF